MKVYFYENGRFEKATGASIFKQSDNANLLELKLPMAQPDSVVYTNFLLPFPEGSEQYGNYSVESLKMTVANDEEDGGYKWVATLPSGYLESYGTAYLSAKISTNSGTVIKTTDRVQFIIEPSGDYTATAVLPEQAEQLNNAIASIEAKIIELQTNVGDLQKDKQDKVDDTLGTPSKVVVEQITDNYNNIVNHEERISNNEGEIAWLKANTQLGENYVGQMSGANLPSDQDLNLYVNTVTGRAPTNGDVIIFIQEIPDQTDKNFKYYFTSNSWKHYEIPALQSARNGVLGTVQGTLGGFANDGANVVVDIVDGKINRIFVQNEDGVETDIKDYLNGNANKIANIVSGATPVGNALKAVADALGNDIVETYLTKNLGATKQYVQDYSMPRIFNDVDFISADGYQDTAPTTPDTGIQFTTETNAVGDFELFKVQKTINATFELSAKNGGANSIWISANENCTVAFRLTTQVLKFGTTEWKDLSVELTSPTTLQAEEITKLTFGSPFTYLGEEVIDVSFGDIIRQTLEVVVSTSSPLTFNVYSNEVYPSIFNLTSQSYTLQQVTDTLGKLIELGMNGIIEANRVVFTVEDSESFIEYRTNLREFFLTAHLPIVVPTLENIDRTLPISITFGDTTYNLYNYLTGGNTPLTLGDLMSVATYSQDVGLLFNFKATFFENSDFVGFVIIPPAITARQIDALIADSDTVVTDLSGDGTRISIHFSAEIVNKLARMLVTPMSPPPSTELVGIGADNMQKMIDLGAGFAIINNTLQGTSQAPYVSYTEPQNLTEEQQAQARSNIGAGSGSFSGSYEDLGQKPTIDTTNTESLTPNANEVLDGKFNLHKISKTGALADAVQDDEYQTLTATEKAQITQNQTDISDLQSDVEKIHEDYLPTAGGTISGDLSVEGSVMGENVIAEAFKTGAEITQFEQDFVLVTDENGNAYKRAMNKLLDDIGGSTVLEDGVRVDNIDISDYAKISDLPSQYWKLQNCTAIPRNADLNDYKQSGNYAVKVGDGTVNTLSNKPSGLNSIFVMQVFSSNGTSSGDYPIQEIISFDRRKYIRRYNNDSQEWTAWSEFIASDYQQNLSNKIFKNLTRFEGDGGNEKPSINMYVSGAYAIAFGDAHGSNVGGHNIVDSTILLGSCDRGTGQWTHQGVASLAVEKDLYLGGRIYLGSTGMITNSNHGWRMDEYGNFHHLRSENTDTWHIDGYDGGENFVVNFETGVTKIKGKEVITLESYTEKSLNQYEFSRCWRFSNGLQICAGEVIWGRTNATSVQTHTINFLLPFAVYAGSQGAYSLMLTMQDSSTSNAHIATPFFDGHSSNKGTSSATFYTQNVNNASYNSGIEWLAVGKWK